MSTQSPAGATVPEPRPPKCPHCKKDMPIVVLYPFQIGQLLLPSIQCPWCAVMLHISIITPQPAKETDIEAQHSGPSKIVMPS
jgi:hypothetical protein